MLLYEEMCQGYVYAALYIDNNLTVGNPQAIDEEALQEYGLVLNVVEELQDYLSCKVKLSVDKKRAWLDAPPDQKFEKEV